MNLLADFNFSVWLVIKIAVIFGLIIYNIFAFIVMKQVNLMTETLELDFEGPIKFVAVFHFIFALFVLGYSFLM
ncbi:hypothetical protein A3A76_02270 [Candidatus Woesebacteria bacterium RIFCSPLOWO2_01_FULL_39_23]|uniref:Uncharacterized protein n=1 Tax=Candidatus Woesebacteria bacterium RIFCSPHIGHO2_01_FULL_40_22 TaxID=1802499 RepID=A0A1F7YFV6_9BACT|nr:MAG: hypothetical protein A2141_03425 [Candidatus Woesebacteria bacterium RBG_16_40_11]OGM26226.1 MAG: hypothetical protein A2628_02705 [Candidatus Woesebacteria bacterium RIFCSPHIGHO2_01_FULL_40_22]OGM36483.1 MAG: hypothetical protein A3E41_00525 [Candidatus Woesebacteria bacterium RIFCSPHIGHO2_12_FULL_38_9]OGM62384.1 MAG: hypothetical protein A3A76_02270 [Candidatus Woesebacteria bacterium RIFCSPLOWO2_01_FULL_39_23]